MYGSGVYNFFKFFKWSLGLNLTLMVLTLMLVTVPEHLNDEETPVCMANVSLEENFFPAALADDSCSEMYLHTQDWKKEQLDVAKNINFFEDVGIILMKLVLGDG